MSFWHGERSWKLEVRYEHPVGCAGRGWRVGADGVRAITSSLGGCRALERSHGVQLPCAPPACTRRAHPLHDNIMPWTKHGGYSGGRNIQTTPKNPILLEVMLNKGSDAWHDCYKKHRKGYWITDPRQPCGSGHPLMEVVMPLLAMPAHVRVRSIGVGAADSESDKFLLRQ